jgi:hypothetical protein
VYVKAYQDEKRSVEQLPLIAQLNVEADALAITQYSTAIWDSPPPSSYVSQAHLVTASGTATAQYKEVVLEKSTSPELRQYIQEKKNWPESTMERVNWSAHGKAFCSQLPC